MEKKNNTIKYILIILILVVILGVILFLVNGKSNNFENLNSSENTSNYSSNSNTDIQITQTSTNIEVKYKDEELVENYTEYTAKVNLTEMTATGNGINISNGTITISADGVYYFTGTATDANIVVNAPDSALVVIVLDNANITSTKTAVINGIEADNIIINLMSESNNTLTDGSTYTVFTEDDEPNATVFSKTDLCINGTGTLTINANYEDAIASKDDLKIINSTIIVKAKDDGIRGKDSLVLKNANITVVSDGDGLKSTNEEAGKGYIYIDGGKYAITSAGDGMDAENIVNLNGDAEINITTTGDVEDKTKSSNQGWQGFGGQRNFADDLNVSDDSDLTVSSKGIKAGSEIAINSGKITISATDDAIHSNGVIIINDVEATLSTGDDGIHADNSIVIKDGIINIAKSYEGIEAQYIEIDGGNIDLISSDDGINVNGGSEQMFRNFSGTDNSSDSNRLLVILGGTINVNANGDGLDSNGSIKISGGTILVAGPTNSGNGSLDYNYTCTVTGGSLIYYGASGMWQDSGSNSTIKTVAFSVSNGKNGDVLELKDSSGNIVAKVTTAKTYQKIGFTNSSIKSGETYTLYVNGTQFSSVKAN